MTVFGRDLLYEGFQSEFASQRPNGDAAFRCREVEFLIFAEASLLEHGLWNTYRSAVAPLYQLCSDGCHAVSIYQRIYVIKNVSSRSLTHSDYKPSPARSLYSPPAPENSLPYRPA